MNQIHIYRIWDDNKSMRLVTHLLRPFLGVETILRNQIWNRTETRTSCRVRAKGMKTKLKEHSEDTKFSSDRAKRTETVWRMDQWLDTSKTYRKAPPDCNGNRDKLDIDPNKFAASEWVCGGNTFEGNFATDLTEKVRSEDGGRDFSGNGN
ncbi:hypothetical protein BDZ45DRAFT_729898 [Acephala macrosclerotiorum]|nr:hypothetical protein BDZ45DRAFT_729898 [Acephala macrosclerotiorum]